MRIVIDMQGMQTASRTRGIGRYTQSFVRALCDQRGDHEIILALNGLYRDTIDPIRRAFSDYIPLNNIRLWHSPALGAWDTPDSWERRERAKLIREEFIASLKPDILHVTSLFEGFRDQAIVSLGERPHPYPTSVTLYDFIPLHHPDRFFATDQGYHKWYQRQLQYMKRFDLHLAISECSKADAEGIIGAEKTIVNVSSACSEFFKPQQISNRDKLALYERLDIKRPFILSSGTVEPHKNTIRLFEAFAKLPLTLRQKYCIVLIGNSMPEHQYMQRDWARSAGLKEEEILLIGYVSDEDLLRLYNLCELLVFPSFDEGFGLPVLEAMSCGAVALGADATSIPEVLQDPRALFDPQDANSMKEKLEEVLLTPTLAREMKRHNIEQSRNFSWSNTGRLALHSMEQLVHQHQRKHDGSENIYQIGSSGFIDAVVNINPNITYDDLLDLSVSIAKSVRTQGQKRQLLVDISELARHDARTGCQRVTRSILIELLNNPPRGFRIEPVAASMDRTGYMYAREFARRLADDADVPGDDLPIDYAPGDIFFGLDFQPTIVSSQENFLLSLRDEGVQVQFLVYDILSLTMPEHFPHGSDLNFRRWLETISKFHGIIGISQTTAAETAAWYARNSVPLREDFRFNFAHLGADIENSSPSAGLPGDAIATIRGLSRIPTFLMVSTIEPRKGHRQTLAAFEELWQRGLEVNLVFVGKEGWNMEDFTRKVRCHPRLNRNLFWLEGISDEYLERVYEAASCLVAASEGEGFGLPLIEAARHRLPILARDIPIFREVAGDHASYFRGSEPSHLAAALNTWLIARKEGNHVRSDNLPWLTWRQSARMMMQALLSDCLHK